MGTAASTVLVSAIITVNDHTVRELCWRIHPMSLFYCTELTLAAVDTMRRMRMMRCRMSTPSRMSSMFFSSRSRRDT